jgi:hypothetical protein
MKKFNQIAAVGAFTALLCGWTASTQSALAYRAFARGANGAAGAYAHSGQYGRRAGAAAISPTQGAGIRGGQYYGPNGGTLQAGGGFGYKQGVGAFRRSGWSGQAANGASGSGYTKNQYNAQTGQGARSSSEQVTNAAGQNYGYNGNTTYTKGEGANSVIQTDNKGSYDVNWDKGQKPVITPVSSTN